MLVLVLNCGSSSVKFQVFASDLDVPTQAGPRRLARGLIERIGEQAVVAMQAEGRPAEHETAQLPNHEAGIRRVLAWTRSAGGALAPVAASGFGAVGHRVVHGGERFTKPVIIDREVAAAIEAVEDLAPLHNAPSLAGIHATHALLGPRVPMVAVFDTAFHAALPEHAHRYAIAYELSLRHRIRRYGFHGTSYRYVLSRYCQITGTPPERATVVALHLGNGCSAAAIKSGKSVDTSMGFTPLEGLTMGTRSGDLDPTLVGYLARVEGVSTAEVERWLNERSGLLGVSGRSRDMRDLLERERDDPRARLAVEIFCYRARKYIGAYLAALGGADAVIFTGGIAENSAEVRARICAGMAWCGLSLDAEQNALASGREGRISDETARLPAFVIPTDEEVVIARDTVECVGRM